MQQGTKRRCEDDPEHKAAQDEVSDVESVRPDSVDMNEVDELLSLNNSDEELDPENETEIIIANRQCIDNGNVDAIVAREYRGATPKLCLPAVSPKLAELVNSWMCVAPKREHIKEMFANALVPENVESLLPVKINEALYVRLPFKAKFNDQRLRGINTFFSRGVGPLLSAIDKLMQAEGLLNTTKSATTVDKTVLTIDDFKIDLKQVRVWLGNALHILAVGNSVVLLKRRNLLKPYLDQKFHGLLKPSNPVSQELLGPDLEQKIAEGTRVSEASKKLTAPFRPLNFNFRNTRFRRDNWQGGYKHLNRGRQPRFAQNSRGQPRTGTPWGGFAPRHAPRGCFDQRRGNISCQNNYRC